MLVAVCGQSHMISTFQLKGICALVFHFALGFVSDV